MPVISSLVTIDEQAEFRNDVQLSDYEKRETNLALLRSYLFTSTAPQGQESSTGILRAIIESFLNPRLDNRIAAIANYGHGKSHLALVLANYFGKPYQSPELKIIFNKIDQALENPGQRQRYREFRESRNEFLVIRLRGDKPAKLREQFVLGLEQSLQEHTATKNVELPFWYKKAEQLLKDLEGDKLSLANQFLHEYGMEVPNLIEDVQRKKDTSYDICIKLFTELHGVAPNFQGEVSSREMINWVAGKYCGDDKPLGGIVVLFDEFSLFIQRYGPSNAAGELMDLLNGIEDQKGKAVFVAFAQHDPIQVAENAIRAGQQLESLKKELDRIPRRVLLYSLMESVINAYLDQPEEAWKKFRSDPETRGPLARASNLSMDLFSKRYEQTFRWDAEKYDEIVTKGCFPLHPLTTAFLCDIRFQGAGSAGNPRTVLGFVFEQINHKRNEAIYQDGKVNWVLPTFLVDYFLDYLPGNSYLLYENALRTLGTDAPQEQVELLKALLLQDIAKLPVRRDTQMAYLAEASGQTLRDADTHLRTLSTKRVIRFDQGTKLYSFWPVAANPHRMEEIIEERLQQTKFSWDLLKELNNSHLPAIPVDIPWGHSDDWAADEKIITLDFFNAKYLQELIPQYQITSKGELIEGKRGCVIWLLAENEDEVNTFRRTAAKILDETFSGENPPAIVLLSPNKPCPQLIEAFLKNRIVDKFNQDDRKEVGIEIYQHELGRLKQLFNAELAGLRGETINYRSITRPNVRYVVANAYRAGIQVFGDISLQRILSELYKLTYRFNAPEFFTEFAISSTNLRNASKGVSAVLLRNGLLSNRDAIYAQPLQKRLCENFLIAKWGLVTPDLRIREPGHQRLEEAWNYLDQAFPAGTKDKRLRNFIAALLNPPYGYDYNTILLLICAWIGYQAHDLQLSEQGRLISLEKFAESLTTSKNPKAFIQLMASNSLAITRRDPGQALLEIQEIIDKIKRGSFTQREAKDAITKLEEFCREHTVDTPLLENANQALDNLTNAKKLAEEYDEEAKKIQASIRNEKTIQVILDQHAKINKLGRPTLVRQTAPQESELLEKWFDKVSELVEGECVRFESVQRITDIGLNREKAQVLKKQLKKIDLPELIVRVDRASKVISEKEKDFEAREREAPVQAEIRAMEIKASLKNLYDYRTRLQEIKGYSEETNMLRDDRLRRISNEIKSLEQYIEQLTGAVDRLVSNNDLIDWQREFDRNYVRYVDTPFQIELDNTEKHIQQLQEYFGKLDAIIRKKPDSPEAAFGLVKELENLRISSEKWLSQQQIGVLESIKRNIEKNVNTQVQEAKRWLENIEYQYKRKESLYRIKDSLGNPPSFLPGEERTRVAQLRQEIQQSLDQDIIGQIEERFCKITDPAKRQLCIERLQKLIEQ